MLAAAPPAARRALSPLRARLEEILSAPTLYYAEDYHQQYLSDAKNPNGYCGLGGTGVSCPAGIGTSD